VSYARWDAVDAYIEQQLFAQDDELEATLDASAAAGLPAIAVSPAQGRLLALIARIHGARRILEIGTLGGYSTILLARTLPVDGQLISLELNPDYAALARANIARAGLAERVKIRVGPALDSLAQLTAEGVEPFDMVFIDADKPRTHESFAAVLALARRGGVIVVDNVVRDGAIADSETHDPSVRGMQRLHELLADEPRVTATTIQTVGSKGYDGFTLALIQ
jgi:predicted O-methyltransferase YrrM